MKRLSGVHTKPATTSESSSSSTTPGSSSLFNIRPSVSRDQQAIVLFFTKWVAEPINGRRGNLEFLPALYGHATKDDCLDSCLKAVSMATLANYFGADDLKITSSIYYGQALRALNTSLDDLTVAGSDQVLTSMHLLQLYDLISGIYSAAQDPHEGGMRQLLQVRGPESCNTSTAKPSLLRFIEAKSELQALNDASESVSPRTGFIGPVVASTPGLALHKLLPRVTAACRGLHMACGNTIDQNIVNVSAAVDRAFDTLGDMTFWRTSLPMDWQYEAFYPPNADKPADITASGRRFLFKDIQHGAMWLAYWCARIHLLLSLIRGCKVLEERSVAVVIPYPPSALAAGIIAIADDCRASGPYMLCELDEHGAPLPQGSGKALGAFYLLNALHVINSVPFLPPASREWMLQQLDKIGRNHGIGQAFKLREQWLAKSRQSPRVSSMSVLRGQSAIRDGGMQFD